VSRAGVTVVIAAGRGGVAPVPTSRPGELILVREGGADEPDSRFDRVVDVFPAGVGYAWNRGLALATAPTVAFLDAAAGSDGPVLFPRQSLLRAGGFDLSLGPLPGPAVELDALLRLERDGIVVDRDAGLAVRGAGAGPAALGRVARRHRRPGLALRSPRIALAALRRPQAVAPLGVLEHAPGALRSELAGLTLEPLPLRRKAKTQFLYRAGEDALLHVYLEPAQLLRRSLAEREAIRTRSGAGGIPRVLASAEGLDSVWVLEELLTGEAPEARRVEAWLPRAAEWAVALAQPPGPPLRESERWAEHRAELVAAAPEELREHVGEAARLVDELASTHMHGDLQPANVLLSGETVGAVDWEGAWLHGIPGLDLVFLTLLAGEGRPEAAVVREIAAGRRLRSELERVGVGPAVVTAALLVHLASWSGSEGRRLTRLGAPPGEPVFGPLLEAVGPELTGQASSSGWRTTAG
jgi:hypothetical protein